MKLIFDNERSPISAVHKFLFTICLIALGCLIARCKKDKTSNSDTEEVVSPLTGSRTELTLDSIFLYAKEIYLWNDALPKYQTFLPREKYLDFGSELNTLKKELFDISQLKINQNTGRPYEYGNYNSPKYSFVQSGRIQSGSRQGGSISGQITTKTSIIESDGKKIAYFSFNSIPPLTEIKTAFDDIFAEIAVEKPKYLILDLRYNGGGYVETAEYLANLIAPSALNGKLMYSEQFNSTLQDGKAKILRHQLYTDEYGKSIIYKGRVATLADVDYTEAGNTYKFNKKGNLQTVESVYVIVSNQTASASEMLISCLMPYFKVKLVGARTYGKPVGFFGVDIDKYAVYLSSFLIKNGQGWSNYFNGMEPDIPIVSDKNPILGDINELCLKAAIAAINNEEMSNGKKISSRGLSSNSVIHPKTSIVESELMESRLRLKN